jgi:hypothetical protein
MNLIFLTGLPVWGVYPIRAFTPYDLGFFATDVPQEDVHDNVPQNMI